jgi:hypothetical protein
LQGHSMAYVPNLRHHLVVQSVGQTDAVCLMPRVETLKSADGALRRDSAVDLDCQKEMSPRRRIVILPCQIRPRKGFCH